MYTIHFFTQNANIVKLKHTCSSLFPVYSTSLIIFVGLYDTPLRYYPTRTKKKCTNSTILPQTLQTPRECRAKRRSTGSLE